MCSQTSKTLLGEFTTISSLLVLICLLGKPFPNLPALFAQIPLKQSHMPY
ncbi:hypothetical protein CsatB_029018 [Cannabis sativa]